MNVYFHIDELNRDAVVASALKKKFAQKGHTLIYGNRMTNAFLKHVHRAFDVVIVPRPHVLYDHWGDDWMTWDARFLTLSSESLGIICKDPHVMARTLLEKEYFEGNSKYVDRIDAFCLWGGKQLQAIKEYASDVLPRCHVVGHPRHDHSCLESQGKKQSCPKAIGVITRAGALNDYFGRSGLDGYRTLFDDHFRYEYFNRETGEKLPSKRPAITPGDAIVVQAIDVESTLKVISALEKTGHNISVRIHPKENFDAWKGLLRNSKLNAEVSSPSQPITSWLNNVDYLIGPPSTSYYDAVMLGVTPISISNLDSRRSQFVGELWEDNNHLMAQVFTPKTITELVDYVTAGKENFGNREILNVLEDEASFPNCETSLDKLVSICIDMVPVFSNREIHLAMFKSLRYVFFKVWRVKNWICRREENSAMFAMGKRETCFIDNLSSGT